jgi:PadR family transcriptional regulator, regulatory protein PadR
MLHVLAALLEEPTEELYGLELSTRAGLQTGTIYPILARLERSGWLSSRWEDIDPRRAGRRPRRYYRLTGLGMREARALLVRTGGEAGTARPGEVTA